MSDEIRKRLQQIEGDVRALRRELVMATPPKEDPRTVLLQLIGSLTICEHMGDVSNAVEIALEKIGLAVGTWDDLGELGDRLGELGVTTLVGTSLEDK